MAGYDDPRYLQSVIEKLQREVAELKKSTIPVLAHQRGPTPGWQNFGQLGPGPGMKSSMHLHNDGNQAGVAPRLSVTDAVGTVRAELGNLAASGISPAQYGFRASNAAGTPIFDSLGLISVMQVLGSVFVSTAFSTTSTTPVVITGCTTTFTPARQSRCLVVYGSSVSYGGAAPNSGFNDLFLDGVNQAFGGNGPALELQFPTTTSGAVTSSGFYTVVLSAASHTIDLRAYQNGTGTVTVQQCAISVLNLGVV